MNPAPLYVPLLSRTANRVFWMSRYVERIEHLARYLNAHYLSSSDTPRHFDKGQMLASMLFMADAEDDFAASGLPYTAERVVCYLLLNEDNPCSIRSYVALIRENARGVRHNISTELWEAVNRFYHAVHAFQPEELEKKGTYSFCKSVMDTATILKGVADNTLLRNDVWSVMQAGTHLERASQMVQMLLAKLEDLDRAAPEKAAGQLFQGYHWGALLRSAGSLDMSRYYYGITPDERRIFEFLVLNRHAPKSLRYNLDQLDQHFKNMGDGQPLAPGSVGFLTGKLAARVRFLTVEEIMDDSRTFFRALQLELTAIGTQFEQQYLSF